MPSHALSRGARLAPLLGLFVVLCVMVLAPHAARAGEKEDNATIAAVEKIFNTEVANANFGEAKKKLRALVDKCKKGCSGPALARVYIAIGAVASQIGQADEAKGAWNDALNLDSNAALPATGVSAEVRAKFEEARKAWLVANPQPDDATKAGWVNKQAFDLAKQAVAAEQKGDYKECIEKNRSALTLEENMRARLHIAQCESKSGKIVDALRDNAKALELARAKNDAVTQKVVQERVTELLPRLAHVKFDRPAEVTDLKIQFDDRQIPVDRLQESFTIDPGEHQVKAEGVLRGARVSYEDKVSVKEGETVTVKITLKPVALTQGQLQCMVAAKTQEEILACLPQDRKPLVIHAGLDVSGYTDTVAVHVLTPAVKGSINSPTAGWNVGASYLVDVLTAASPDVVSTASRRFHDTRHAVTANGGFKPGAFGGQLYGAYSTERDYISRTIGGNITGDLMDKQVSPILGYAFTSDTIGRAGTDYDVFGRPFKTHEISAGSTFVLTATSVLVLGGMVQLESGDQSKPYRYIPLFERGVSVPIGASAEEVNATRLATKPLEQLPLSRQRYSIGGRLIKRLGSATLRLEERLYRDSWAITATTTDARYLVDVSPRLRVWPHAHLHLQTAASFYNRIYGADLNSDGSATIPKFRTSDRELSPMAGLTGGGGIRYELTEPGGKISIAVFSTADVLFNYYVNSLYIRTRLAGYGTIGIEADFE